MNTVPSGFYNSRVQQLSATHGQLKSKKLQFAWLRFLSFLLVPLAAWLLWGNGFWIVAPVIFGLLALFVFVIKKDLQNKEAIANTELLIQVNRDEQQYLQHDFYSFADGKQLQPEHHVYANDLDLFGRSSLYQYINRTTSQQGHQLFADWLLEPALPETVLQRQKAVKELAEEKEWRQQLQAFGIASPLQLKTQQNISQWLKDPSQFLHKTGWTIARFLLPLISFVILGAFLGGYIPDQAFYSLLLMMLCLNLLVSKKILKAWLQLGKITEELDTLSNSLRWIEQKSFESELLQQLKQKSSSNGQVKASQSIRQLKKILDRFDYRLNPVVFIPLSVFLAWDLQQIIALEKWKEKNQQELQHWFEALAEFETLSSLGNLRFNHPGWCMPELVTGDAVFEGTEIGHPLLPVNKRVNNSFATNGVPAINLITGSNMAGKSTFLRSVGVNIVLAMMGAPACAGTLRLSPLKVISSMRISDNLEESTSTFYAELKKLKEVIDAVNRKENVFLLLDEILRGTNSADRHAGSKALIKQLVQHNGAGIVATHDLELAKLEQEHPGSIHNYHFDVQVTGEELYFDYRLKRGVCQSMNASILMKKIGIEL